MSKGNNHEFYNPYQFIPVKKPNDLVSYETIAKGKDSAVRHDLWCKETYTGRITCILKLVTPTFVGARHHKGDESTPNCYEHYEREGIPAIPGNSLRGMIGSLIEALSNSALRRLDEKPYTVRLRPEEDNSSQFKLGRVVYKDRRYYIRQVNYFKVAREEALKIWKKSKEKKFWGDPKKKEVFTENQKGLKNGELRILNINNIKKLLPPRRNHELFVYKKDSASDFQIEQEAIKRYEEICQECWDESEGKPVRMPLLYAGRKDGEWKLSDGLLLFYRLENKKAVELRLSQIWRSHTHKSAHDYFSAVSSHLLPWGTQKRMENGNDKLTPAERLLGVAEEVSNDQRGNQMARNLASRIRFSDALLSTNDGTPYGDEVLLRILASPKPPSPAMYFNKNNGAVTKKDLLGEVGAIRPNGRKFYLNHPDSQIKQERWRTADQYENEDLKQKIRIKPLKKGLEFEFSIDFENLTAAELTLLKTALCPSEKFHHRLGLGRPLGLGSVKLTIKRLQLCNKKERYGQNALDAPLFDKNKDNGWPEDDSLIDQAVLKVVRKLGEFNGNGKEVRPPLTQGQLMRGMKIQGSNVSGDWEKNTYEWFVQNDRNCRSGRYVKRQYLGPASGESVKCLQSMPDNNCKQSVANQSSGGNNRNRKGKNRKRKQKTR